MNPEQVGIDYPNLERDWEAHLIWLIENLPEWTAKAFRTNRKSLRDRLRKTTQTAALQRMILLQEGKLASDQIVEGIFNRIMAPPNGPAITNPDLEPMPDEIQSHILGWSQNLHDPTM